MSIRVPGLLHPWQTCSAFVTTPFLCTQVCITVCLFGWACESQVLPPVRAVGFPVAFQCCGVAWLRGWGLKPCQTWCSLSHPLSTSPSSSLLLGPAPSLSLAQSAQTRPAPAQAGDPVVWSRLFVCEGSLPTAAQSFCSLAHVQSPQTKNPIDYCGGEVGTCFRDRFDLIRRVLCFALKVTVQHKECYRLGMRL